MINTVQQALEDVYVALGGQEDIDRLTVSQVLAKIYNVLGGTGDHGQETVPQLIDLIATVAPSGGGGSSDWTSAEVTFVNSDTTTVYVVNTCTLYEENFIIAGGAVVSTSITATIPLYKGKGYLDFSAFSSIDNGTMPTVSGDISIDIEDSTFVITGNGTITCKGIGGN